MMDRRTLILAATGCLLATATAAFAADVTEKRTVSGFNGIRLSVPAKLEVIQGGTEGLVIEGPAEDLAKVETVVEDGALHIRRPKSERTKWDNWNPKLRITVNAIRVESLAIAGAGNIASNSLRSPSLKLAISGSGHIKLPSIDTEKLVVAISGSGDMAVAGKAGSVNTHISGSGDLKAERLDAREAKVSIAGSGDVALWARQSLHVKIAGAGDVRYYGDPTVEKVIAGSGSVTRLGLAPS